MECGAQRNHLVRPVQAPLPTQLWSSSRSLRWTVVGKNASNTAHVGRRPDSPKSHIETRRDRDNAARAPPPPASRGRTQYVSDSSGGVAPRWQSQQRTSGGVAPLMDVVGLRKYPSKCSITVQEAGWRHLQPAQDRPDQSMTLTISGFPKLSINLS